ncbi:hypothetical protein L6164_027320 [Bauhinia variegata]|uniref:Uncharacterized protein n=1 Tax=Bauhinia variegata TaxID=167791 RepID=A0ACB9LTP7_BAUVA|nr:hypothetical protein L6164_027320 [Bauhinia variegata]
MELCTLKAIQPPLLASTSHSHLLPKSSICLRLPITRTPSLLSRSFYLSNLPPRATASEETPGGPSCYVDEKQDEKQVQPFFSTDRKAFNETLTSEETKDESPVAEQVQPFFSTDWKASNETLTSEETKDESPVVEQVQPFFSTDWKASNETLTSEETKDESPVVEQVQPFFSTDWKASNETLTSEETKDESPVVEQVQPFFSTDWKASNETLTSEETKDESPVVEQVQAFDSTDEKAFIETLASEETKDKSPVDEQVQPFVILDNLNIKFGTDDTTSILLYGGGAIVALWLTSTVVSAIDSIPLFPKLLEVVGLAYTLWFTSRNLLFKQNRDELAAKIEELKEQVLGPDEDQ